MATSDHSMNPLLMYIGGSILFMVVIHFMVGIEKGSNTWIMGGIFLLGGAIGWALDSYISGFVFAVVFNFLFW